MNNYEAIMDKFRRLHCCMKRRSGSENPGSYGRAQGRALRTISENDGIRSTQLASLLGIRPASLTEHLNRLEEDGNIERVRDLHDARVIHINITEVGRQALRQRRQDDRRLSKDFSDCLTDQEVVLFCQLCDRMSDRLEEIQQSQQALAAKGVAKLSDEKAARQIASRGKDQDVAK